VSAETVSRPSAIVSLLHSSVVVLNAIGSLWVLLLVILICSDALGRSFFNRPIDGVTELVAVTMAVIVFCQLADTVRLGKLTRSDAFLSKLEASNSTLAALVVISFDILGIAVMVCIIWGTTPLLIESIERGYYIGEQGVFTLPDWPIKAIVVLGSVACALCFLVRAVHHWMLVSERRRG
jgi:TRAP-type mannitol/chloroaromatic compound transport system permease small subunit